ncbi:unnamed protein product [Prunus armeniaca]
MDESNIQMKSPHVENSCSLITKLNNSVCTNTSSYEETSPENCSVDHEADLKHSRENLLVSYILIAYFIHRDSLMHEEEQLHDEEKTGSDTLQQAGEVPEFSKTMVVLIILQKYGQPMVVQVKGELIFRTAEGLLSSEQGVYIAESVAAKNIKEAERRFRMPWTMEVLIILQKQSQPTVVQVKGKLGSPQRNLVSYCCICFSTGNFFHALEHPQ